LANQDPFPNDRFFGALPALIELIIFYMPIKEAEIRPSQTLPSTLAHNSPTATPHYDTFLFVDSLTNRSITVRHIWDRGRTHRHSKTQDLGSKAEIKQLDGCIDFLKETMAFRKNALL
jgi:hypothetical protein